VAHPPSQREPAVAFGLNAWLVAFPGIVGVTYIDWMTGRDLGLSLFYLGPIWWLAAKSGRPAGIAGAVVAAAGWWLAEAWGGPPPIAAVTVLWNALIRLGIFVVVAWLVGEVRLRRAAEQRVAAAAGELEEIVRQRTSDYEEANRRLESEVKERAMAQKALKQLNENLEREVQLRNRELASKVDRLLDSEKMLQREQGILQSILDHIGDGVLLVNGDGRLQTFNPAAAVFFPGALAVGEVPGWLGDRSLLPAETRLGAGAESLLGILLAGRALDGVELRVPIAEGARESWLRISGRPLFGDQQLVLGAVLVVRDAAAERTLERAILAISEREQRRFGQELHDGLCQQLVSMSLGLSAMRLRLGTTAPAEQTELAALEELVQQALTESRRLARGLYPVALELGGLAPALRELVERQRGLRGWRCHFHEAGPELEGLDPMVAVNLYRITQEAVTNALKHSGGQYLEVILETGQNAIELTVRDDGAGMIKSPAQPGMGMSGMKDRARLIGATLSWNDHPEGGLTVRCRWQGVSELPAVGPGPQATLNDA
jgi:signal transduction histidine kinase